MVVIRLIGGDIKSDCYYEDLNLEKFSESSVLKEMGDWASKNNIKLEKFMGDYSFEKSKYDYSEEELLNLDGDITFKINEYTCGTKVMTPDGGIYFCPGFIELKEPIGNFRELDIVTLEELTYDLYLKKLYMCTSDDVEDIKRMCPVKHRCDKKMCYYLNRKITGESRFPFSRFCAIKESEYKNRYNKKDSDILFLVLNSLAKINEAILSLGTDSPDFNIKNRINQIVKEVNDNIDLSIKKSEGQNDNAS